MDYVIPAPEQVSVAVAGENKRFPVRRIFCVGRNYVAHIREMGGDERDPPFYFCKPADAIVPTGGTIDYPPQTSNFHYEMELVAAIGKGGANYSEADALDHVNGYATGLDMTRRDLQGIAKDKRRPWDIGKDFENSAVFASASRAGDVGALEGLTVRLSVNGRVRQDAFLGDMVHSVPEVVADLSKYYHLAPGDVILTGTPAGVGPVVAGDVLDGEIGGLDPIRLTIGPAE